MASMQLLQVDLIIQDVYFDPPTDAVAVDELGNVSLGEGQGEPAPLSTATWNRWFQQWLSMLNPTLANNQLYELVLRLTTDAEIQTLNAQYRHIDRPTDVLAFAALEVDYPQIDGGLDDQPLYLGDIVISVETAADQAHQRGHSLALELAWLASHGLLHLLGWDHPDEASLRRMLDQQAALLQTVDLTIQYD